MDRKRKPLRQGSRVSDLEAAGGAEWIMSLLANAWTQRGWQVTLETLSTQESDFYFLNREIYRVGLDLVGNSRNLTEAGSRE
jgi:hypothetical protein